ncbi:2-hydroxyacid dehydrogenase [Nitrosomonas sp. JL21]|uniref:2-hydroxyacid dehydrogenase n=1 Tax=Nitrosomonas sp. JL21 TaxID=153949 RepID=UPI00136AF348|nr:2-hydroxyacid dehydrogenase [Nitrosomonas sp. JL21]MBL8498353.1 2-hydroxyacid dehydrogenase [Nitrosomonas sp.]MCC7091162.1 2-hydroxyacid dehydrogenase [Nitrosomonas sp.]MXS77570.1 2-hydroxyacid dehydrogenase [Nitrosomonas sp. JL21]
MRAVFLDFGSVTRGDMDCGSMERAISPWQYFDDSSEQDVLERIQSADVAVSNKVYIGHEAIVAAKHLKLICVAATGYNNIDLAAAAEHAVPVCNVRGYATPSVVQHVFMLMLNLARHFVDYQALVKEGGWQASRFFCPLDYDIQELSGKKLGIIGFGELGQAVAEVARAFGMQVLIADHKGKLPCPGRMAFDDVMRDADVITLHCPYSQETHQLISRREFELMKPSALLINTARGQLVNEADLLHSLRTHRIAGAALDVIQEEPPGADNSMLRQLPPNLIVTPHIAWASRESRQRLLDQLAGNIRHFFRNEPFNQIMDALHSSAAGQR